VVAAANDVVYRVGADVSDYVDGMQQSAAATEGFERATKKDFTSGLVRALEQAQTQARLMAGEVTKGQLAVERFQKAGGSEEMINRLKAAQAEVERLAKQESAAAERRKIEADRQKQIIDDNLRHNQQQQAAIDNYKAAQARRDEANVQRQLALYEQAAAVKASLLTSEERLQQELLRLQELRNRGLLTEQQLQQAATNATVAAAAAARNAPGSVASLKFGMIAQQGAIGLQDAMSAYQVTGNPASALSSFGNNAIQMASLMNPVLGTVAALTVLGGQLALAFGKSKDEAAKMKAEIEGAKAASDLWAKTGDERAKGIESEKLKEAELQDQIAASGRVRAEVAKELDDHYWKSINRAPMPDLGPQAGWLPEDAAKYEELLRLLEGIDKGKPELEAALAKQQAMLRLQQGAATPAGVVSGAEWAGAKQVVAAANRESKAREVENNWRRAEGLLSVEDEAVASRYRGMMEEKQLEEARQISRTAEEAAKLNIELEKMKEAGVSQGTIEEFKKLTKELQEQERAAREIEKRRGKAADLVAKSGAMFMDAKSIRDANRTPDQVMNDEADRLLKLEASGFLSRDDARMQMARTQQGLQAQQTLSSALVRGSSEEVSALNNLQAQSEAAKLAMGMADQTLALRENTAEMQAFRRQLESKGTGIFEDAAFLGID
jgi:hypothetical protein